MEATAYAESGTSEGRLGARIDIPSVLRRIAMGSMMERKVGAMEGAKRRPEHMQRKGKASL